MIGSEQSASAALSRRIANGPAILDRSQPSVEYLPDESCEARTRVNSEKAKALKAMRLLKAGNAK
jgi:hypothetical protein